MVLIQSSDFYGGFSHWSPFPTLIDIPLNPKGLSSPFLQVFLFLWSGFFLGTSPERSVWRETDCSAASERSILTFFSPEAAVSACSPFIAHFFKPVVGFRLFLLRSSIAVPISFISSSITVSIEHQGLVHQLVFLPAWSFA